MSPDYSTEYHVNQEYSSNLTGLGIKKSRSIHNHNLKEVVVVVLIFFTSTVNI